MALPPSLIEALQISTAHGFGCLGRSAARPVSIPRWRNHCIQGTIQRCPGTLLGVRLMSWHAAKTTGANKHNATKDGSELVTVRLRQLPERVVQSQPDYSSILLDVPRTFRSAAGSSTAAAGQVQIPLAAGSEQSGGGVAGLRDAHTLMQSRWKRIGVVYSPSTAWQEVLTDALAEIKRCGNLSDGTLQSCHRCLDGIAQTVVHSSAHRLLRLARLLADNAVAAAETDLSDFSRRTRSLCTVLVEAVGRQNRTLTLPEYSALLQTVVQLHALPDTERLTFSTAWCAAVMSSYRGSVRDGVPPSLMRDFLQCSAGGWNMSTYTRQQLIDAIRFLLSATSSNVFPTASALIQFAEGITPLTPTIVALPEFLSAISSLETISSSEEAAMIMAIILENKTKQLDSDIRLSLAFIEHLPVPCLLDVGHVLTTNGVVVPNTVLSALVGRLMAEDLSGISNSQLLSLFTTLDAFAVTSQEVYCALLKHVNSSGWTSSVARDPGLVPLAQVVARRLHGVSQETHLGIPEVVDFWKNYSKLTHSAIKQEWYKSIAAGDAEQLRGLTKGMWDLACSVESDALKVLMLETLAPHLGSPLVLTVLQQLNIDDVLAVSASPLRSKLDLTHSIVLALSSLSSAERVIVLPLVAKHCLACSEKHGFRYFFCGLVYPPVLYLTFDSLVTVVRALILFDVTQNRNEQHVMDNTEALIKQLCRTISPRHANQYFTESGLTQLLSIASACINDPMGSALFGIAPEAVGSRWTWARYLKPLGEQCARQTLDCSDIDEMRKVMQYAAASKQADSCHRLLFVLSEQILSKVDTLSPDVLRAVCTCLQTAKIDEELPTFGDLAANYTAIGNLAAEFDSADWHDAQLSYFTCLHGSLGVQCVALGDCVCTRAVSKDIDIWKLVSVIVCHGNSLPYSLHDTFLEQLSDPVAVSENIPFADLFFIAEMLPGLGRSKELRASAWLCLRDVVMSERHMHDEACVGNAAVELLKCGQHLHLSSEQVQPLVSTVLSLPHWCLRTLRLAACNQIFLVPALREATFGDVHPYYDWFARIPSLISVQLATVWQSRSLVGFGQEQIEESTVLFDFLESCSHAMAAAKACGTHVHMPYAFDIDTSGFRAMFDKASEGSPGTPLRTIVRLATTGLLDADAAQAPGRHLLFDTCMELLADEQLFSAEGSLLDDRSVLGRLALYAAIQFQKQGESRAPSSCAAGGNGPPPSSPLAHLARVEENCSRGLASYDSRVMGKYTMDGKNLFGILGSLFHDSDYVIEPSRLDLPLNVAAVCALDSAGVPLKPAKREPESADRPGGATECVWPVDTHYRVAWLVKPELNKDTGVDGLLDSLLLNCAALQLLEKSDFTIVEVPADLVHSETSLSGKYKESTLSYVKRGVLRGLLTEKLGVL